jgi:hypothetical protein
MITVRCGNRDGGVHCERMPCRPGALYCGEHCSCPPDGSCAKDPPSVVAPALDPGLTAWLKGEVPDAFYQPTWRLEIVNGVGTGTISIDPAVEAPGYDRYHNDQPETKVKLR